MTKPGQIDRIDLKILKALQSDARMTNQALADAVGLSPSPCLQRVKRLEQRGILKGYVGRVALDTIAHSVSVSSPPYRSRATPRSSSTVSNRPPRRFPSWSSATRSAVRSIIFSNSSARTCRPMNASATIYYVTGLKA